MHASSTSLSALANLLRPPPFPLLLKDFNAAMYFNDKKSAVRNDRYTTLGVAGARLAVEDAGLNIKAVDPGQSVI